MRVAFLIFKRYGACGVAGEIFPDNQFKREFTFLSDNAFYCFCQIRGMVISDHQNTDARVRVKTKLVGDFDQIIAGNFVIQFCFSLFLIV
mgnify:CR=1 FL=1